MNARAIGIASPTGVAWTFLGNAIKALDMPGWGWWAAWAVLTEPSLLKVSAYDATPVYLDVLGSPPFGRPV
jgi:hypothetical protein